MSSQTENKFGSVDIPENINFSKICRDESLHVDFCIRLLRLDKMNNTYPSTHSDSEKDPETCDQEEDWDQEDWYREEDDDQEDDESIC